MSRRSAALTAMVVALLMAVGCGTTDEQADGQRIVVTTNILGDVARSIVGDTAQVDVLMKPNADPHSFAPSAKEADRMSGADLIIANGLGLEEGLQRQVDSAAGRGVPTLAIGDHIDPIPYTDGETEGAPDPHFWMDPQRMLTAVDVIEQAVLEHVAGIDQATLTANAEAYRQQLQTLSDSMTQRFSAVPTEQRSLVSNHHVLGYLADRYDLTVVGAVVPSGTTLASPSPSDLESLAGAIRKANVRTIFVDSSQPDRLARALAEHAGVDGINIVSLYTESLGEPGTPAATYVDLMRANTDTIINGLRR
ncbi:zinc ABC transporter substrate-binding protein AztC [soil metagenome]